MSDEYNQGLEDAAILLEKWSRDWDQLAYVRSQSTNRDRMSELLRKRTLREAETLRDRAQQMTNMARMVRELKKEAPLSLKKSFEPGEEVVNKREMWGVCIVKQVLQPGETRLIFQTGLQAVEKSTEVRYVVQTTSGALFLWTAADTIRYARRR